MKTLEELAEMKTTDLTDVLPKIIIAAVETALRTKRFGRSLVKINTDIVGKPGRSIHVPCHGSITASKVSEGCAIPGAAEVKFQYKTQEITPGKAAVMVRITQEAIDATQYDLVREYITEAGEALADLEDVDIIEALTSKTALNETHAASADEQAGDYIQIAKCILYVTAITGSVTGALTVKSVSVSDCITKIYVNENIVAENLTTVGFEAATRKWACGTNYCCCVSATTYGTLAYEDIVAAVTKIRANKWTPDFMLIHPNQMSDLIKDNRFIDTSRYGSSEPILNGEVGKVGGLKILTSTNMIEGVALVMDATKAAYLVMKRNIDLKRWENPSTDCTELYFWYEYGVGVTRPEALCMIVGSGTFKK